MKKNILSYISAILLLFCLGSCSDEPFNRASIDYDEPVISLTAGKFEKIETRAGINEDEVESAWIGIYSGGERIYERFFTDLSVSGDIYSRSVEMDTDVKEAGKITVYVVANRDMRQGDTSTETSLQQINDNPAEATMAMWSKEEFDSYKELAGHTFRLVRNRAKFTAKVASGSLAEGRGFVIDGFHVASGNDEGVVVNPGLQEGKIVLGGDAGETVYSYPTADEGICVIVKGGYGADINNYYRAEFKYNRTGSNPILANHHYELLVETADDTGYGSLDAALKGSSNATVKICDHLPMILSMVSDGENELAVTDTVHCDGVNFEKVSNHVDETYKFHVKLASKTIDLSKITIDNVLDKNYVNHVNVTVNDDWIRLGRDINMQVRKPKELSRDSFTDQYGDDVPYVEFEFYVDVDKSIGGMARVGYLNLEWEGLKRQVVIEQEYDFNPTAIGECTWLINGSDSNLNYFSMIAGNGYGETNMNKVYGIQPVQNGGQVRNQGFHFPMGLKKDYNSSEYVSYAYKLKLDPKPNGGAWQNVKYKVEITDPWFASRVTGATNGFVTLGSNSVIDIQWKGSVESGKESEYRVGSKALKITYSYTLSGSKASGEFVYTFDLYHTGFIYNDLYSDDYGVGNEVPESGWYYYGVVPIQFENGTKRFWLDRNIGAKASGMYVEDGNGNNLFEGSGEGTWPYNKESRGGLYSAAVPSQGGSFQMIPRVAPPGFRVPSVAEWQGLTALADFHYQSIYDFGEVYWDAYYSQVMQDQSIRMVRFPKARRILAGDRETSGTTAVGYYWTNTPAIGISGTGEEAGKWVQCIKFERSSRSYGRARIVSTTGSGNLGMSVRCIDDTDDNSTLTRINFNVAGYTNIYVYQQSGNSKMPLNDWSGDEIVPPGTWVTGDQYYDYTLETYVNAPEGSKLYVILVKKNSSGEIESWWNGEVHGGKPSGSVDNLTGYEVTVPAQGQYIRLPGNGSGSTLITRKYRLRWYKGSPYLWKIRIDNGTWIEVGSNTENVNNLECYYYEFQKTGTAEELNDMSIYPEWTGDDGIGLYRKSYNNGKIPLKIGEESWWRFDESIGAYVYGASDNELNYFGCFQKL